MGEMIHSPTPWARSFSDGASHIRDANGNSLFCDEKYYPWASTKDFDFIVAAVNSFADHERLMAAAHERIKVLEEALRKLYNEVSGMLGYAQEGLRAAVGNTNLSVLQGRIDEARAILSPAGTEDSHA